MNFIRRTKTTLFFLVLFCSASTVICAQQTSKDQKQQIEAPPAPAEQTTKGSVTVGGTDINYVARAGTISLTNDKSDTTAHIFYTAYLKDGVGDRSQRPVMFLFNGGPGSSTVWLHMGSFAPVRVGTKDTTRISAAPYELLDNEYSLLDATDLVFIDAPATGFSRIVGKGKDKDYLGVDEDARAFAEFIKRYITKFNRWNSPKYLFGESYGTTRNAVLTNLLVTRDNIDLNGVIMLSQILDFGNSVGRPSSGNDRPYQLALPTYAATAWYHKQIPDRPDDLEPFLEEVENFAMDEYASALSKGSEISDSELNTIAEQLHRYIGLPVDYLKKANLRVTGGEFEKQLQSEEGITTGRLDSRFSGPSMEPLSQGANYDPQSAAISSAYITVFNDYVRNTLNFGRKMQFRPSNYGDWNFQRGGRSMGLNVMPDLAEAMKHNPNMRILLTGGYYDLATPYFEGEYEMHHLDIPKSLQDNISYAYYPSGHMVYLHLPSLKKLHDDVADFIEKTDNL